MTIAFVHPTPIDNYIEFFNEGRQFVGYTREREQVDFIVIDSIGMLCYVEGVVCEFDPLSWMMITENEEVICQLDQFVPTNNFV